MCVDYVMMSHLSEDKKLGYSDTNLVILDTSYHINSFVK